MESAAGVDDDGDTVVGLVVFPGGSVDINEFVFLFGEGAVGVGLA